MDVLGLGLIKINDWFLLFVILLVSLYYYLTWHHKVWETLGVAGPKPLPVLGTMLPFFKRGVFMDLDYFKKYGKIVGTYEGRTPVLLVADPEFLKSVLVKEFHAFGARRNGDGGTFVDLNLFNSRGDHWKLLRQTISPTFSTGKIKAMMTDLNDCSSSLVENLEKEVKEGNVFDVRSFTASYTMDVISRVAFGLRIDSQTDKENKFVKYMNTIFDSVNDSFNPLLMFFFLFPGLVKYLGMIGISIFPKHILEFFHSVVSQTLEVREQETEERKDFLNLIRNAHKTPKSEETKSEGDVEKRPLTMDEIQAQAFLFFLAGYDTTANALCWLVYNLACNPDQQERAYQEIHDVIGNSAKITYDQMNQLPYLEQCIMETLRLYPSATRLDREAGEDITIQGVHIPKGAVVVFSPMAIHRLPELYPDPETFNPDRFEGKSMGYLDTYDYLPFGGGPRACIGMRLALLELRLAAVKLIRRFRFQTTPKTQIPPKLGIALNLREKDGTWLKAELRSD